MRKSRFILIVIVFIFISGLTFPGGKPAGQEKKKTIKYRIDPKKVKKILPLYIKKVAYLLADENDGGFKYEADQVEKAVKKLGYVVKRIHSSDAVQMMNNDIDTRNFGPLDRVFIICQGHGGGGDESHGIYSTPNDWRNHYFVIGQNSDFVRIYAHHLSNAARKIRNKGAAVIVLDASCKGGATVKHFEHEFPGDAKVCAFATTGPFTPSLVGFPSFGYALDTLTLQAFKNLSHWGTKKLMEAAHGSNKDGNGRIHQMAYMNTCTATMRMREGIGTGCSGFSTWWAWNRKRDVHVLLCPERYADKDPQSLSNPNYAPDPDEIKAEQDMIKFAVKWLNDLDQVNDEFKQQTILNVSTFHYHVNQYITLINAWKATFLRLNNKFKNIKLLGHTLGDQLRSVLRHPVCIPRIHIRLQRAIPDLNIRFRTKKFPYSIWQDYLMPVPKKKSLFKLTPRRRTYTKAVKPRASLKLQKTAERGILLPPGKFILQPSEEIQKKRLLKYSLMACKNVSQLVPEVLKDYPLLKIDYDLYRQQETVIRRKMIELSIELQAIEAQLFKGGCLPCKKIYIK